MHSKRVRIVIVVLIFAFVSVFFNFFTQAFAQGDPLYNFIQNGTFEDGMAFWDCDPTEDGTCTIDSSEGVPAPSGLTSGSGNGGRPVLSQTFYVPVKWQRTTVAPTCTVCKTRA